MSTSRQSPNGTLPPAPWTRPGRTDAGQMRVISSIFIFFISSNLVNSQSTRDSTAFNTSSPAICPVELSGLLKPVYISLPTCSLSSRPADPIPEFLSFEEWKAKQLTEQESLHREKDSHSPSTHFAGTHQESKTESLAAQSSEGSAGSKKDNILEDHVNASTSENSIESAASSSPRSHIPLIDRFNYASDECNARIQSSHKTAKSASSILSRKKDRYMLSPCRTNKEKQYVIVELCEDIRIDTVQLANFEFFSGVFKDIRVSVAHTYTPDGQGWVTVGEYTAKNIRGVQSFHPYKELLPFYRYIRIDFLGYYGSEYFCPISVLRVYGLTQMEEWKLDVWKAEWEASQMTLSGPASVIVEPEIIIPEGNTTSLTTDKEDTQDVNQIDLSTSQVIDTGGQPALDAEVEKEESIDPMDKNDTGMTGSESPVHDPTTTETIDQLRPGSLPPTEVSSPSVEPSSIKDAVWSLSATEEATPFIDSLSDYDEEEEDIRVHSVIYIDIPQTLTPTATPTATIAIDSSTEAKRTVTKTVSTTITLSSATPAASPLNTAVLGGESIYRMIVNRLTNLEANHTLYAKYVEEQGRTVNIRLERLEEDIGRLGGIVTSQQQHLSKLLERHKSQVELEHKKLALQVEHLAQEVLMEKRLGVVQLVLLLAVLIFMALTRGSRGEPLRLSRASAAWNRSLQTSGEWVSGWRSGGVRADSGPTEASSISLKETKKKLALKLPFTVRSESSTASRRRPSVERRRRSSSRGPLAQRDLFPTPQRRPVELNRSRRGSTQSRSRAHTPPRASAPLIETTNSPFKIAHPPSSSLHTVSVPDPNLNEAHTRPNLPGGWRSGRSISLTGPQEYNSNPIPGVGADVGGSGKKKLAKTSHMHEFKSRSRGGTLNELDASLTLLSPMAEDPSTPATANEWSKDNTATRTPSRVVPMPQTPRSSHEQSTIIAPSENRALSPQVDGSNFQLAGVPFPSPNPDTETTVYGREDDMWVDESGSERAPHDQEANRRSPKGVQRFTSPHRAFVFSSSPSGGKNRFKLRRGDGNHKATASTGSTGRE